MIGVVSSQIPPVPLKPLEVSHLLAFEEWRLVREAHPDMAMDPKAYGFEWDAPTHCWVRRSTARGWVDRLYAPPRTSAFWLYPDEVDEVCRGIDWERRVGDRIRHFLEWGAFGSA